MRQRTALLLLCSPKQAKQLSFARQESESLSSASNCVKIIRIKQSAGFLRPIIFFRTQLENLSKVSDGWQPENICFFAYAKLMNMSDDNNQAEFRYT